MRSAVFFSDSQVDYHEREDDALASGRSWAGFHPQTNLVWLHFVLESLIQNIRWPSREMKRTLEDVELEGMDGKQVKQRAKALESALKKLRRRLRIQNVPRPGFGSACALVTTALEEGWLAEEDVVGEGESSLASIIE